MFCGGCSSFPKVRDGRRSPESADRRTLGKIWIEMLDAELPGCSECLKLQQAFNAAVLVNCSCRSVVGTRRAHILVFTEAFLVGRQLSPLKRVLIVDTCCGSLHLVHGTPFLPRNLNRIFDSCYQHPLDQHLRWAFLGLVMMVLVFS